MKAKSRCIPALVLLALLLSGGRMASGAGLRDGQAIFMAPLADDTINCLAARLPGGFDYQVVEDASHATTQNGVLLSLVCNYILSTQDSNPAGPGHPSGAAITIDYACPEETKESWTSKTASARDNEIARTDNSLLLHDSGEFTGFAGDFTVEEKMFLLLDTHTMATIVVLTGPDPNNTNNLIFSANNAQVIAASLTQINGPKANDPACGPPPGPGSATSPGQTPVPGATSVPAGSGNPSDTFGGRPWDYISNAVAVGVAVGAGVIAAIASGLVTGMGGGAMRSFAQAGSSANSASSAGSLTVPAVAAPAAPAVGTVSTVSPSGTTQPAGVGPQAPPATGTQTGFSAPPTQQVQPEPVIPPDIQPVVDAAEAALVVGGVLTQTDAANTSDQESTKDEDSQDNEGETPCPEALASLFGLPAANSRSDCPGTRPSMGPWYSGIDFTSNDEYNVPAMLDFEACVTGEVTYAGGPFNMIEVKVENGNRIQHLHASEVYVSVGQQVGANTKLGRTGGTGPGGPAQYEVHLHIQAIDEHGNMIDPDCAISGGDNRKLRTGQSGSPHAERIRQEKATGETGSVTQTMTTEHTPQSPASTSSIECANCGQISPPNARFCGKCGQPLAR